MGIAPSTQMIGFNSSCIEYIIIIALITSCITKGGYSNYEVVRVS